MRRMMISLLASMIVLLAVHTSYAQNSKFYLDAGAGQIQLSEGATIRVAGTEIPGADVAITDSLTFGVEIGYFFYRNFAVSATLGLPPTTTITAAGSLAGSGTVGELTYGPAAVTVHYHFNRNGRIRPYIGGGVTPLVVFGTKDGVLRDLKVENSLGPTIHAGVDLMFTDRLGIYGDVKKSRLRTSATGFLGSAPVVADTKFDPLVFSTGIAFRF